VTYRERQRVSDIIAALDAINAHLQRGSLPDGQVFDAVRIRLLEIGEAVKAMPDELLATEPAIPWTQIARSRGLCSSGEGVVGGGGNPSTTEGTEDRPPLMPNLRHCESCILIGS
jgi:hypothetical protein